MKSKKYTLSILITLALLLSFCITAFALPSDSEIHSMMSTSDDGTYNIKLLDAYSYKYYGYSSASSWIEIPNTKVIIFTPSETITKDTLYLANNSNGSDAEGFLSVSARENINAPDVTAENTSSGGNQGKIIGVTTDMEYKSSDQSTWTVIDSNLIKGESPNQYIEVPCGTYSVRNKVCVDNGYYTFPSKAKQVTIASTLGLSVGGVTVTTANQSNIPVDKGSASYDSTNKVLTLTGVEIKNSDINGNAIYVSPDLENLTIKISGECSIEPIVAKEVTGSDGNIYLKSTGIFTDGVNLTITDSQQSGDILNIETPKGDVLSGISTSGTSKNGNLTVSSNINIDVDEAQSRVIGVEANSTQISESKSVLITLDDCEGEAVGIVTYGEDSENSAITISDNASLTVTTGKATAIAGILAQSKTDNGNAVGGTINCSGNIAVQTGNTTSEAQVCSNRGIVATSLNLTGGDSNVLTGTIAGENTSCAAELSTLLAVSNNASLSLLGATQSSNLEVSKLSVADNYVVIAGESASTATVQAKPYSDKILSANKYAHIGASQIDISITSESLKAGETATATAVTVPAGKSIIWTCTATPSDCATFSEPLTSPNLTITATGAGSVEVTAELVNRPDILKTKTITISADPVITFNPTEIDVDDSTIYTVKNLPSDCVVGVKGEPTTCFDLTTTSTSSGTITAKEPGKVTVFVLRNYTLSQSTNPKNVTYDSSAVIAEETIDFGYKFGIDIDDNMYVGDSYIAKTDGTLTGTVKWESSDTSIASITEAGTITAKKSGTTSIKATITTASGAKYHSAATLTVSQRPSITTEQSAYYLKLSTPVTVPVTVVPVGSNFTVTSSDTSGTYLTYTCTQPTSTSTGSIVLTGKSSTSAPVTLTLALKDYPSVTKELKIYVDDLSNTTMTRVSSQTISFTSLTGSKAAQVALSPVTDYAKSHIIWTSQNTAVAQVSKDTNDSQIASVTPKANGTTTVTAQLVDNVSNPQHIYQTVTFTVQVSSATNYTYTYPSGYNKLIWYYDGGANLTFKTNIPAATINQYGIQIWYSSSKIYTVPAGQFTVETESTTGNSVVTINETWLYNNLPHSKLKYNLNTFYGSSTCITKVLYVQSVQDTPPTGDQDMSLYSALLVISGLMCAIIPTAYYVKKKIFKSK